MKRRFLATVVGLLTAASLSISPMAATTADAGVISAGQQDFEDGAFPELMDYTDAQAGEAAPFSGLIGSDVTGDNFSAEWTFDYGAGDVISALLSFGIYDADSSASGDQVGSFTADGADLTDLMNEVFETSGGAQMEYNVYTLELPADIMVQLTDGAVTFALTLAGPGIGFFGDTTSNGAGLDFARLEMLPEPSTVLLMLLGIFALTAARPGRRC